jgi:hypothetical protein
MPPEDMPPAEMQEEETSRKKTPRAEYIVLGVLFLGALLAFPAFRDVQMLQDFVISICAGFGFT